MTSRACLAVAFISGIPVMAACSGPTVNASCDVEGVTAEVEHMVGESELAVKSLDALDCSGDWAVAQVTVTGKAEDKATFIFRRSEAGWIMKSPETACGADSSLEPIPSALTDVACPIG